MITSQQVLRDLSRPDLAPDLAFGADADAGFSPLADCGGGSGSGGDGGDGDDGGDAEAARQLRAALAAWPPAAASEAGVSGGGEAARVAALVGAALAAFRRRQRRRLVALCDERLGFELGLLESARDPPQLLVLGGTAATGGGGGGGGGSGDGAAGARRACFGVALEGLDLSCAEPLIRYHGTSGSDSGTGVSSSGSRPGEAAAAAAGDGSGSAGAACGGAASGFVLNAAFKTGAAAAHAPPALSLAAPRWFFAAGLPPLALPAWNPHAPLAEYAELARDRLQEHLARSCAAALPRHRLVAALAALLGPPLEARMAPSAPPGGAAPPAALPPPGSGLPAAPSYSSVAAAAAGGGGAGIGGAGSSSAAATAAWAAVFQVLHDQQPLLLFVEGSARFPEEQPALTLQSAR